MADREFVVMLRVGLLGKCYLLGNGRGGLDELCGQGFYRYVQGYTGERH